MGVPNYSFPVGWAKIPKTSPIGKPIRYEVHAPAVVRSVGRGTGNLRDADPFLGSLEAKRETFLLVNPIHPFVIDLPAFARQQDV